jgi:hypothetical protein
LRASAVMRVLICSKVRRASSRTSVEGTEVVRVVIVKGDYFSVFPQALIQNHARTA